MSSETFGSAVLAAALATSAWGNSWELTLPEADGCTNGAPVTLSDGNYELNGYIVSASGKTVGIGQSLSAGNYATGQALRTDAGGAYIGHGDLDMTGPVTVGGAASEWTITQIGGNSFNQVYKAPFEVCTLPTTLVKMGSASFQGCGSTSGFGTFRLEAPNMTGELPNNTFLTSRAPTNVILRIPNVTCIGGYWSRTGYVDFMKDTDVTDWDVSSVQKIQITSGHAKGTMGYFFRYSKFRGTLNLPSLMWLGPQTFENCPNMNGLVAGSKGTLECVGAYAVTNCPALGSLVLGGVAAGWTVSTNAFYTPNLTNVTFATTPPTWIESTSIIFGTEQTPAKQIAFFIPARGSRSDWETKWSKFARAAREATDAERAEFAQRFGNYAAEGLVGIVPPAAFRTAAEQWLVCGHSPLLRYTVKASVLDPRFTGDAVTVSPAPDADGCYAPGTQVTLTATPDASLGVFGKWRGAGIPEALVRNPSITLTVDRDWDLQANFFHDWTFRLDDPSATVKAWAKGTISNQVWKFNVVVSDTGNDKLRIGRDGVAGGGWTDFGEGLLDLNGRVFMEGEGGSRTEFTICGYYGNALQGPKDEYNISTARWPRHIILPETATTVPGQVFRCQDANYTPTNIVVEYDQLTGSFGTDDFCQMTLKKASFKVPKISGAMSGYSNTPQFDPTVDVSEWRLDSISEVVGERAGNWGVFRGMFTSKNFTGTLYLPSLAVICTNAFVNTKNLGAMELGSNTVVTSIGARAFKGCTSLARLRLRSGRDLAVSDEDTFTGTTSLRTLEFTSFAPANPAVVDTMLAGTTEPVLTAAEPTVIYASRLCGWDRAHIANIKVPTNEERAALPFWVPADGHVTGVWETAGGVRKAWVVHVPSADDPNGTVLFFR